MLFPGGADGGSPAANGRDFLPLCGNPVIQLSAGTICIPELYTGASAGYAVCHGLLKLRYSGDSHCRGHFRSRWNTACSCVFDSPESGHVDAGTVFFCSEKWKIFFEKSFDASVYCSGADWYRLDAVKSAIAGFGNRKPESHWRMQHSIIHDSGGKHCCRYEYGPITPPGYAVFFSCSVGTAAAGGSSGM